MMFGYDGASWGVGGWLIAAVLMVLFWGAVVTAVVWGFRRAGSPERHSGSAVAPHASAEQILAERFARGEIDETEFRARRAGLRDSE